MLAVAVLVPSLLLGLETLLPLEGKKKGITVSVLVIMTGHSQTEICVPMGLPNLETNGRLGWNGGGREERVHGVQSGDLVLAVTYGPF